MDPTVLPYGPVWKWGIFCESVVSISDQPVDRMGKHFLDKAIHPVTTCILPLYILYIYICKTLYHKLSTNHVQKIFLSRQGWEIVGNKFPLNPNRVACPNIQECILLFKGSWEPCVDVLMNNNHQHMWCVRLFFHDRLDFPNVRLDNQRSGVW